VNKHAIFLSLTDNYVYLFNALLNSIELFGIGKYADVVVIHDDSITEDIITFYQAHTECMETNVIFKRIIPYAEDKDLGKVMTVKYYRYKIMAELGAAYSSICFMDTDIFFASDVAEYFEIAAKTNLFVGVNDNVTRHYKCDTSKGQAPGFSDTREPVFTEELWDGKFICNVPTFIDMNKYGDVFIDVWRHRRKLGMDSTWPFTGDLETMNIVMNKHGIKDNLIVLPSHLWTGVHYSIYRVSTMAKRTGVPSGVKISDSKYNPKILFMSETFEHIRSFHGRDWTDERNVQRIKEHNIPKLLSQMEGDFRDKTLTQAINKRCNLFDSIQAYFLFLQFRCGVSLDDVVKCVQVRQYDYLKTRAEELKSTIGSFG